MNILIGIVLYTISLTKNHYNHVIINNIMTIEDICRVACVTIDELREENRVISLAGEEIDYLPQGLCVYGLDLKECPNLKSLPEDLQIR